MKKNTNLAVTTRYYFSLIKKEVVRKMMVKTEIISSKYQNIDREFAVRSFLSKKVFTKDGEYLGNVYDAIQKNYSIEGIIVSKYFFNRTFIDIDYIDKFTPEGIILKITPVTMILGKEVFDDEGKALGKVRKINRKSNANSYESLVVKKGLFSKERIIYPKDISVLKNNIILKISVDK